MRDDVFDTKEIIDLRKKIEIVNEQIARLNREIEHIKLKQHHNESSDEENAKIDTLLYSLAIYEKRHEALLIKKRELESKEYNKYFSSYPIIKRH